MTRNTPIVTESRLQLLDLRPTVSYESFLPVPVPVHGRLSPLPPLTDRQLSSPGMMTPATLRQSWAPTSRSDDHISLPAGHIGGGSRAEHVANAMACTDYPPESLAKVENYKQNLNSLSVEWTRLSVEKDPHVLSALMWNWIDELKVSTQPATQGSQARGVVGAITLLKNTGVRISFYPCKL